MGLNGSMDELEFARRLVDAAGGLGAEATEVYTSRSASTEMRIDRGKPESVKITRDQGFGVRVLLEEKMGFASSNDMDLETAKDLVRELLKNASHHTPDENNVIPEPVDGFCVDETLERYDDRIETLDPEAKIRKAVEIEKAAMEYDERIKGAMWLQYGDNATEDVIVNSRGAEYRSRGTAAYAFAWMIASDGPDTQSGSHDDVCAFFDELDAGALGRRAAENAVRMLGAGDIKSPEIPLVLPPETASSLFGFLAGMVNADLAQKGKTFFKDKLGEPVASERVTVIDDGKLPGGLASCSFDGEGVPTSTTTVIEAGTLKSFLFNAYAAKKGGTRSTGNAVRGGYRGSPGISPTNFYVRPGDMGPDEIISGLSEALYVTDLQGLHAAVNTTTGDLSIPAKGIMIRGGEMAEPVQNLIIGGNLIGLLRGIEAVGSDLAWSSASGMIGVPTILTSPVRIGGRS